MYMNFFSFCQKDEENDCVSAFLPEDIDISSVQLIEENGMYFLPVNFVLKRLSVDENGLNVSSNLTGIQNLWPDNLNNDMAWPLFSERLKSIIATTLTGKEQLKWLVCSVVLNEESRKYYLPIFHSKFDILDETRCIYDDYGCIIKYVYSSLKVQPYSIFPEPDYNNWWEISPVLYVSEVLKKAIQKAKLTGLVMEKATVIR